MRSAPVALFAWLICVAPCFAGGPVAALVEDVSPGAVGLEAMEYVEPGKVIRLGPQDSIVLTYLNSCVRERIVGGIVTVGREMSEVSSGKVERTSTTCDSGRMLLTTEIASNSAGHVLRSLERKQDHSRLQPQR